MSTQCVTCHGVYELMQRDGQRYFHACPPLSDAEVIAALGINVDRTKWSAADATAFAAAPRVRPNARNENAPDAATLKPLIDALKSTDPTEYWKHVNALRDTAIVSAGAGTQ